MAVNTSNRENGVNAAWQTGLTETTMRLGLARLANPADKRALQTIVEQSGRPEMSLPAMSLGSLDTRYALTTLKWSREDVTKRGVEVDPKLLKEVEARLEREKL